MNPISINLRATAPEPITQRIRPECPTDIDAKEPLAALLFWERRPEVDRRFSENIRSVFAKMSFSGMARGARQLRGRQARLPLL